MKKILSILLAIFNSTSLIAGDIWVSPQGNDQQEGSKDAPLRTIQQAVKQAREWRRLHDPRINRGIRIMLQQGVYPQEKTLFFRPEDSGTENSPTIIQAAEGAEAVISGGISIKGWTKAANNLWVADAPILGNRHLEFRQLWINGKKAQRASQFPDGVMERMIDFNKEKETITIPTPQIKGLEHAKQLEMIVHQRWAIAILRVKKLDIQGEKTVVSFHNPESQLEFAHPWPQPVIGESKGNSSFCLVNALELVDEPGEWFQEYPSGKIYYYPRLGEEISNIEAIAPTLEELVHIDGSLERPVHHLQFKNINFEHTSWNRPSYEGHVTLQGGFRLLDAYKLLIPGLPEKAELENQAWIARPETAIRVKGGSHINFDGCTFQHMGATGVDYEWAVTNSKIENCLFTDIGGTAIQIGTFPDGGFETHVPFKPVNEQELCSDILIKNNLITEVTNEDWGCVGIGAGYVKNATIIHNEVCNVNYSGICVGWGWTLLESGMKNNRIEANYVHHFARRLYDAGGLYTLSNQPNSIMANNRIEALIDAPYATNDRAFYIYFDEATDGYTVENNWCPEVRFDSNRPGPKNVWKNNGPNVSESIKLKAGRIK